MIIKTARLIIILMPLYWILLSFGLMYMMEWLPIILLQYTSMISIIFPFIDCLRVITEALDLIIG
jgi:hypothetical protein